MEPMDRGAPAGMDWMGWDGMEKERSREAHAGVTGMPKSEIPAGGRAATTSLFLKQSQRLQTPF